MNQPAGAVSDKIKDILFAKSAEKIDAAMSPEVAVTSGDLVRSRQNSEAEVQDAVD